MPEITYNIKQEKLVQPAEVLTIEALQGLYQIAQVETVHVVTGCEAFYFAMQRSGPRGDWDEVTMPPGHYIVVRVVQKPTPNAGLYAVKAPTADNR